MERATVYSAQPPFGQGSAAAATLDHLGKT
jgi:hypothetical protein